MRTGKIASLLFSVVLGAISAAIVVVALLLPDVHEHLQTSNVLLQSLILFSLLGLTYLLILFPVGASIDRAILQLRRNLENGAEAEMVRPLDSRPRWLRPLVWAISEAIARYQEDRRRLREELRYAETKHMDAESQKWRSEAVLHTLRDVVIVTDGLDRIVMMNESAGELFDLDLSRIKHRPLDQVIPSPQLCELIRDTRETADIGELRHCETRVSISTENDRDSSKIATFDACLMCVEQKDGEVGGVVAVLHDLTPQRELSELKNDFVAKASHELRTPLSSIRAYIELLIDGEAEDTTSREQFYRIIHEEAERLSQLIDNMLNISRIEAGMVQIETQEVNIGALIEQVGHAMEPHALERNLILVPSLEQKGLKVEADRDMLYQVLLNLLSNAVKYTPEGGRITLSAEEDQLTRSVVFTVADTGLGIPEEAHLRIFEKFYRLENYKQMAKGTGLGLTLCKHIVESLHHGHIGVESRVGMGAKFWFSIPIRYERIRKAA